jgi:hypothetical protein
MNPNDVKLYDDRKPGSPGELVQHGGALLTRGHVESIMRKAAAKRRRAEIDLALQYARAEQHQRSTVLREAKAHLDALRAEHGPALEALEREEARLQERLAALDAEL